MSPAYFSTTFKKETGQAYIAYLDRGVPDKAVELWEKLDDKTPCDRGPRWAIRAELFSYVFKKRLAYRPPNSGASSE